MRDVPIAEFKDNASAFVAAAKAGEDIIITRHGKPMAKLTAVDGVAAEIEKPTPAQREAARRTEQREAVEALVVLGREHRAKYGSVSIDEIIAWKNEGRR